MCDCGPSDDGEVGPVRRSTAEERLRARKACEAGEPRRHRFQELPFWGQGFGGGSGGGGECCQRAGFE